MKTIAFIIGIIAALALSQGNKRQEVKQPSAAVSAVHTDSVLEAGRIERMKNKLLQMQ